MTRIAFTEHFIYPPDLGKKKKNWQVIVPAITFHRTPSSRRADISFPGFIPFDLAPLHTHQSSPCSKWRIPRAEDYLVQLTGGPHKGGFVYEPAPNEIVSLPFLRRLFCLDSSFKSLCKRITNFILMLQKSCAPCRRTNNEDRYILLYEAKK